MSTTEAPRISVVTISLNQARWLPRCLDSVAEQDYPDVEHIVVDPGSTDGSREIISSYPSQIQAIFEPDDGPADGLNRGFAAASGEILCYINADDYLLPGALTVASLRFSELKSDAIYGHGIVVDECGNFIRPFRSPRFDPRILALDGCSVCQQATFFTRRAFDAVGGFNAGNRTCWDSELLFDISLAGLDIVRVSDVLGAYRLHPDSITGSGRLAQQVIDDLSSLSTRIPEEMWTFPWRLFPRTTARILRYVQAPGVLASRLWFGKTTTPKEEERSARQMLGLLRDVDRPPMK